MLLSLVFDTLHRGGLPDGLQLAGRKLVFLFLRPFALNVLKRNLSCRVEYVVGESERGL